MGFIRIMGFKTQGIPSKCAVLCRDHQGLGYNITVWEVESTTATPISQALAITEQNSTLARTTLVPGYAKALLEIGVKGEDSEVLVKKYDIYFEAIVALAVLFVRVRDF